MTMTDVAHYLWDSAGENLERVVIDLLDIKRHYRSSQLDPQIVYARVAAIDSKIGALRGVMLNKEAYPWVEDKL